MENKSTSQNKEKIPSEKSDIIHYTPEEEAKITHIREDLPIFKFKEKILKTILKNDVNFFPLKNQTRCV